MFFTKKKKKEEEKVNLDNSTFSYWEKAEPGTFVSLSDEQAIEEAMRLGKGTTCMDYQILTITKIEETNGLANWLFLQLDCPENELYLMLKSVGNKLDIRIYFALPEISTKTDGSVVTQADNEIEDFFTANLENIEKKVFLIGEETHAAKPSGYFEEAIQH